MAQVAAIWHGSRFELRLLQRATNGNCQCMDETPAQQRTCSAHAMLTDQRTLDHLLSVLRDRTRFVAAEFKDS